MRWWKRQTVQKSHHKCWKTPKKVVMRNVTHKCTSTLTGHGISDNKLIYILLFVCAHVWVHEGFSLFTFKGSVGSTCLLVLHVWSQQNNKPKYVLKTFAGGGIDNTVRTLNGIWCLVWQCDRRSHGRFKPSPKPQNTTRLSRGEKTGKKEKSSWNKLSKYLWTETWTGLSAIPCWTTADYDLLNRYACKYASTWLKMIYYQRD